MKFQDAKLYAVLLPANARRSAPALALGGNGATRATFYRRKDAEAFRKGLSEHGVRGGRVVKVKVTYEVEA